MPLSCPTASRRAVSLCSSSFAVVLTRIAKMPFGILECNRMEHVPGTGMSIFPLLRYL